MEPLFSLETSLGIGILLAALAVVLGLVLLMANTCRHEWLRRYDFEQRRAYLSCRLCNAKSPGWTYGQSHSGQGKDAA
jgi:hypothetical protein